MSSSSSSASLLEKKEGISIRQVNLNTLSTPLPARPDDASREITLPDLHGNPLRLIEELHHQGVLEMDAKDYADFRSIYSSCAKTAMSLTQKNVIDRIIHNLRIKPERLGLLRLIGDDLCDRGSNDYIMLKLLNQLKTGGLKYEIIFSNHTAGFFEFITRLKNKIPGAFDPGFSPSTSLDNLRSTMATGVVTAEEIIKLFDESYFPFSKLLSYSVERSTEAKTEAKPSITVFTHAPVGITTLKNLAEQLKVPCPELKESKDVIALIDRLNAVFQRDVKETTVLYKKAAMESALFKIIWNRKLEADDIDMEDVKFIFGHTGATPYQLQASDATPRKGEIYLQTKEEGIRFQMIGNDGLLKDEMITKEKISEMIIDFLIEQKLEPTVLSWYEDMLLDNVKTNFQGALKAYTTDVLLMLIGYASKKGYREKNPYVVDPQAIFPGRSSHLGIDLSELGKSSSDMLGKSYTVTMHPSSKLRLVTEASLEVKAKLPTSTSSVTTSSSSLFPSVKSETSSVDIIIKTIDLIKTTGLVSPSAGCFKVIDKLVNEYLKPEIPSKNIINYLLTVLATWSGNPTASTPQEKFKKVVNYFNDSIATRNEADDQIRILAMFLKVFLKNNPYPALLPFNDLITQRDGKEIYPTITESLKLTQDISSAPKSSL